MFIFAISVLVGQDFSGRMGLVASSAQRETYIAEVPGHVIIKRLHFAQVSLGILGDFRGLGLDLRRGSNTVFFQAGVPAAKLLPALKRRHLHV